MPDFLTPLYESNDCHNPAGSPAGGEFCSKKGAADDDILARVDQFGTITVQVGTEGHRKFGQRMLAKLMKLEQAGVLERLPSTGGVTPIMAKARYMNNKVRGYATEHTFRRKAGAVATADPTMDARRARAKARVTERRRRLASMAASERERRRQSPGTLGGIAQQQRDERMARGRATQKLVRAIRARKD